MKAAYLHPKAKPNHKHWYAYDVVFDGECIVSDSRDPEHDLARARRRTLMDDDLDALSKAVL